MAASRSLTSGLATAKANSNTAKVRRANTRKSRKRLRALRR